MKTLTSWPSWLALLAIVVLVIVLATFRVNDPDIPHYLANGQYIVENGFDDDCIFNYSHDDCQDASKVEWLSHVLTYGIFSLGGWGAINLAQIALALGIFVIALSSNWRRGVSLLAVAIIGLPAAIIMADRYMLRADQFALLVAASLLALLFQLESHRFYPDKIKQRWLAIATLFFLQVLWANLHGSWPLGIIFVGAFFGSDIIRTVWLKSTNAYVVPLFSPTTYFLGGSLLLLVLASLANPYGLDAFFYPLEFFTADDAFRFQPENQSPLMPTDVRHLSVTLYAWLGLAVVAVFGSAYRKLRLVDILLLAVGLYLSLSAVRHIVLFALLALFIAPRYVDALLALPAKREQLWFKNSFVALLIALTLWTGWNTANNARYFAEQRSRRFGWGVSELIYPSAAAEFIEQKNLAGQLFNDYNLGTFINWRLYPRRQSFVDGHTYTQSSIDVYNSIMQGTTSYQEAVEQYDIGFFFLSHTNPGAYRLIQQLVADPVWAPVYFDELAIVFVDDRPEHKNVIADHQVEFTSLPTDQLNVIERPENKALGFVWRGTFFANLSLWKKAAESFKQALSSDPSDYRAWTNLGAAYHQLGQLEHAEVAYQSALAITKRYAPTHANLGLLYEKVGNTDQAGQEFERALRLNRTQQQAISGLQRLHSGVSGIAPSTDNEAINLLNEGNSFSQQSRHEEAKESYQAALVLDDTMAIAHLNLGIIYAYHLPDPNKAIEHWQRYLDLEPGAEDRAQIEAAIGQLVRQQIAAQQDTGQNQ